MTLKKLNNWRFLSFKESGVFLIVVITELKTSGDNPPFGLLVCTTQNHALVQYACAGIDNQVFVSKYQFGLPGTEEIREFVEGVIRDE